MRLIPSDPDVQTLVSRIRSGQIDLQPDFQRGVVWPDKKRRALIDSILRDWHIPPIHLVRSGDDEEQVVLDGHQRLASIHDFANDDLTVDGNTEPRDESISALDGMRFSDLPDKFRRRFERFTIRVFTIIDYSPEEPYELFYRLNQPSVLTSSEKRNAFFGPARTQVRDLVERAIEAGMTRERIGFSNSRLAYDDAIARFCLMLEHKTINRRINSWEITEKYRSHAPFDPEVIQIARESTTTFASLPCFDDGEIRLNKATFQSWLWFVANTRTPKLDTAILSAYVMSFEYARHLVKFGIQDKANEVFDKMTRPSDAALSLYNDRATSRVTDVLSVLSRDIILWLCFSESFFKIANRYPCGKQIRSMLLEAGSARELERLIADMAATSEWGWLQ